MGVIEDKNLARLRFNISYRIRSILKPRWCCLIFWHGMAFTMTSSTFTCPIRKKAILFLQCHKLWTSLSPCFCSLLDLFCSRQVLFLFFFKKKRMDANYMFLLENTAMFLNFLKHVFKNSDKKVKLSLSSHKAQMVI